MAAYGTPDVAIAGLLFSGEAHDVESSIAQEAIAFGAPVYGAVGIENKCYASHNDKATVTYTSDTESTSVLTTVINGTSIATTYGGGSHAATMTAHLVAINANATLIAAGIVAAAGGSARIFTVTAPVGTTLVVTSAITVAGPATGAVVYTTNAKFLGVAVFVQTGSRLVGAGTACYEAYSSVSILREGKIWVLAESTASDKDPAYAVSNGAGTVGKFTDVSTLNYDIGGYFRSNYNGGYAVLEVRGLK